MSEDLAKAGIEALAIHGNKSQGARQKALGSFQDGDVKVLVATDIVARGIHVDDISHVINFDLPEEPESYVHRIGPARHAPASRASHSRWVDPSERSKLKQIEKLTGLTFELQKTDYAAHVDLNAPEEKRPPRAGRGRPGGGRPQNRSGGGQRTGEARGQRQGAGPGGNAGAKPGGRSGNRRRSGGGGGQGRSASAN